MKELVSDELRRRLLVEAVQGSISRGALVVSQTPYAASLIRGTTTKYIYVDEYGETQETFGESDSTRLDNILAGVAVILGVVGLIMSFQPVSLLSGMGIVWAGAALAVGAFVLAVVAKVPRKSVVAALLLALMAGGSALYDSHQLDQRRQEIQQLFNNSPLGTP